MAAGVEQGYLVLADVSGYTGFVAGIELEHANGIMGDLIQQMLDGLSPPFELVQVEGDAVFVHGRGDVLTRGETMLELIESTYAGFRRRQEVMAARTSCGCGACSSIESLDLKFITHFGGYAWHHAGGQRAPVGNDVNLVHRLLKNGVAERTGWKGYAMFTQPALAQLGIDAGAMHRGEEEYEHIGKVPTASFDLRSRFDELRGSAPAPERRECHWSTELDLPAAQAVVWEWLNDPVKRSRWVGERTVEAELPAGGRTGPGAVYHCHHGKGVVDHTIVEWSPFTSFSEEVKPRAGVRTLLTWNLDPANGGTRLRLDVQMSAPLPSALRRRLCRVFAERELRGDLARLETELIEAAA